MLELAPELQDIIFSLLDRKDLWSLLQVSRPFRKIAQFPLLLRYNIPASQIYSGSVTLPSDAYFLLPLIYHIHPILKLTIAPGGLRMRILPSAFAAVPPISDITVSGALYPHGDFDVARLIVAASPMRDGRGTVIIAGQGAVRLSQYRRVAPIMFWPIPTMNWGIACTTLACLIPFLTSFLVALIVNAYLSLTWLWRRVLGPEWDSNARIASELTVLGGPASLRVQIVAVSGETPFTLATFSNFTLSYITLNHFPTLSSAHHTALLATLDLTAELRFLIVKRNCSLDLSALLGFIRRHGLLHKLILETGAIDSASLTTEPPSDTSGGQITSLSSPAIYIPSILATQRSVTHLTITSWAHVSQLARALKAAASEHRVHTLTLHLERPRYWRHTLPWRTNRDPEEAAPLPSVRHLALVGQSDYEANIQGLAHWLGNFPPLVSVEFRGQMMPLRQRVALVNAIVEGRRNLDVTEWEGVYFNP
ncbi:hypothetical protein DFH06DRAFT_1481707 [Mycena polygramma]|nr:hypothetical protein DFH06DRAFT_1481707 [Mycena polygramma]